MGPCGESELCPNWKKRFSLAQLLGLVRISARVPLFVSRPPEAQKNQENHPFTRGGITKNRNKDLTFHKSGGTKRNTKKGKFP